MVLACLRCRPDDRTGEGMVLQLSQSKPGGAQRDAEPAAVFLCGR